MSCRAMTGAEVQQKADEGFSGLCSHVSRDKISVILAPPVSR